MSTETLATLLLPLVCAGTAAVSLLAAYIIKRLKWDVPVWLPTAVSIISLAASVFFGITQIPRASQAAGPGPGTGVTSSPAAHAPSAPPDSPTTAPPASPATDPPASTTTAPPASPDPSPTVSPSSPGSVPPTTPASPAPFASPVFIEGASGTPYAGKCVDVRGPSKDPGTPVQIWHCKTVDEMRWQLTPAGDIQGFGGNCLTAAGANADATPVLMEPCDDNTLGQHWQVRPDGHISDTEGSCLDIQGPSADDSTALQIWQCQNVPEELWQLTA